MKMSLKIILIFIGIIVLLVSIDLGSICLRNKPIFALSPNNKYGYKKYIGLLYDTYYCTEYPRVLIKAKWSNYSCPYKIQTNENDGGWYNGD